MLSPTGCEYRHEAEGGKVKPFRGGTHYSDLPDLKSKTVAMALFYAVLEKFARLLFWV